MQKARAQKLTRSRQPLLFLQVDDPYSYLLLQALVGSGSITAMGPKIFVVGPAAADVDPEPALAKAWARRDAAELARYYNLDFMDHSQNCDVALAERALAAYAGSGDYAAAHSVLAAYWQGEATALSKLMAAAPRQAWSRADRDANDQLLRQLGHYRGGMLFVDGRWHWGIDRLRYAAPKVALKARPLPAATSIALRQNLDFYFSFRSPYSYIALERVRALAEAYGVSLRIRPVLPMVMRGLPVPPQKKLYILQDAKREADRAGVAFGHVNDPIGGGVERCMAIVPLALASGKLYAYVHSVATGIWSEAADVRSDADLSRLCERAGLPWRQAQPLLSQSSWRELAEANRQALLALGLWGVPTFAIGRFAAWGQDRIDILTARLAEGNFEP